VLGDEADGGGVVIDRQGDDPDANVRQGGAGALEGAQLAVAVGTPRAAEEEHHAELASERLWHSNGLPAEDGERQFGKVSPGCSKDIGRLLISIGWPGPRRDHPVIGDKPSIRLDHVATASGGRDRSRRWPRGTTKRRSSSACGHSRITQACPARVVLGDRSADAHHRR
jgi:hypothetical protein